MAGGVSSRHGWLWGPGYLNLCCSTAGQVWGPSNTRAGSGLMVGRLDPVMGSSRAAVVLGLLSAYWWVRLALGLEQDSW